MAKMPSAAKRGRSEAEPGSDFDALIEGLRSEVIDYVDKNLKSTAGHLTSNFTHLIKAHDQKCERRFSKIENQGEDVDTKHVDLEAQMAALKEQVAAAQRQLHRQETATSSATVPPVSGRPFNDPIDTTILRIETGNKNLIAKETLEAYVSVLFTEANVNADE